MDYHNAIILTCLSSDASKFEELGLVEESQCGPTTTLTGKDASLTLASLGRNGLWSNAMVMT